MGSQLFFLRLVAKCWFHNAGFTLGDATKKAEIGLLGTQDTQTESVEGARTATDSLHHHHQS